MCRGGDPCPCDGMALGVVFWTLRGGLPIRDYFCPVSPLPNPTGNAIAGVGGKLQFELSVLSQRKGMLGHI